MPNRILLADDHEVVRQGLRAILAARPEWEICAEATNGRQALEQAKEFKPDLVIMDIAMPDLNGLSATRQILKELPRTEVLIVTVHDPEHMVRAVLDAGAHGFILKSDAGRDLIAAVDALLKHGFSFSNKVSELMLQGFLKSPRPATDDDVRLTPREQEIVQLLAEGKANKDVASMLGIGVRTVETHRRHIMAKLNMHNVGELVRYAVRRGLVEP